MVLTYARGQIEGLGYRVTVATSAAEALSLLEIHQDVDLLFSDIVMPGEMNGLQLAAVVADQHPKMKVLLTSGYSDVALAQSDTPMRDVQILKKPYRRQDLALSIRAVMDL